MTGTDPSQGTLKERGKYHCAVDLLFDWFGISCMTTDYFCFYLQNRLSKPVKQEVNCTVILPPLVFPALAYINCGYKKFYNICPWMIVEVGKKVPLPLPAGVAGSQDPHDFGPREG